MKLYYISVCVVRHSQIDLCGLGDGGKKLWGIDGSDRGDMKSWTVIQRYS